MQSRRMVCLAMALALGVVCATDASAAVTYDFTASGPDDLTGSFSYTTPSFIVPNTTVPVSALTSCVISDGACLQEQFLNGGGHDIVVFWNTSGIIDEGDFYYFSGGVFGAPGTYATQLLSGIHDGTLIVSGSPGVPEPATWAMMLMGLFGLGAVLRASRRAPVVARSIAG